MNSKIDVIIPVLNEAATIDSLLNRLQSCSLVDKIILCDSPHSTDDMAIKSAEFINVQYVRCSTAGRACQMNAGALYSRNEILYFVHADTLPPTDFGQFIVDSVLGGHPVGCFSYQFKPTNRWLNINAKATRKKNAFTGGGDQSLFITKFLWEEIGGFNERFCIMEDFELVRRLRKKGYRLKLIVQDMVVSSRKYQLNSYLRVNIVNAIVFGMFKIGFGPEILKKVYQYLLNNRS